LAIALLESYLCTRG